MLPVACFVLLHVWCVCLLRFAMNMLCFFCAVLAVCMLLFFVLLHVIAVLHVLCLQCVLCFFYMVYVCVVACIVACIGLIKCFLMRAHIVCALLLLRFA